MALTLGSGPFSRQPGGAFNFRREGPASTLYLERSPRWIRGFLGDQVVLDSRDVRLLHETNHLPTYYFPREDVRGELIESDTHTRCPWKGEASYYHLRVGDRLVEDAIWYYPEPLAGAAGLTGLVAFYWGKLDRWMEEDE